jgi:hypothetical protein
MAGPVIVENTSNSSKFAAKMLLPAVELSIMNLLVISRNSDQCLIGEKATQQSKPHLHVPLELECTPVLSELLFTHMLSPQFHAAFRSYLAAATFSSPRRALHPAIVKAVQDVICSHFHQSTYVDSSVLDSPTGHLAAFVGAADDVVYSLACQHLEKAISQNSDASIEVLMQSVQTAVAAVFELFQEDSESGIASSPAPAHTSTSDASSFPEELFQSLEGLGLPRVACHLALRNTDGDLHRAAEWLVSNIASLDELVEADQLKQSETSHAISQHASLPSLPAPKPLPRAVAAVSAACASRVLARLTAEFKIFARSLPWGSPTCDQFFTMLGQSILTDSAQSAFIAGLKLAGDSAGSSDLEQAKAAEGAGVVYQIVPALLHSFIDVTRQIKCHPTYGVFSSESLSSKTSRAPLPKPKSKVHKPSDIERSITEMGFPASKVQLAMRRNPGFTDIANQQHLNGLMEAIFSLDDDDVELRALEEEQMAAAISSTAAAAAASEAEAPAVLLPASDPMMMKFFGLSAALRYSLMCQGLWEAAGRGDLGMVHAVVASAASFPSTMSSSPPPLNSAQPDTCQVLDSLHLLLGYRELVSSLCKSIIPTTQSKTFESEHPYAHNLDDEFSISFPGATSIEIVFDPKCRTESSCDYLRFWQGSAQVGQDKYHGGSSGWPRLIVQGDSLRATFHSDGSQNDWGYRFTATALCPPIPHWADFSKTAAVVQPLLDACIAQVFTRENVFCVPLSLLALFEGHHDLLFPSHQPASAVLSQELHPTDNSSSFRLDGSVNGDDDDDDDDDDADDDDDDDDDDDAGDADNGDDEDGYGGEDDVDVQDADQVEVDGHDYAGAEDELVSAALVSDGSGLLEPIKMTRHVENGSELASEALSADAVDSQQKDGAVPSSSIFVQVIEVC